MGYPLRTLCLITVELFFLMNQPIPIVSQTGYSSAHSSVFDIVGIVDIAASTEPDKSAILNHFFTQLSYHFGVSEYGSHIAVIDLHSSNEPLLSLSDGLSADAVAKAFTEVQAGDADAGDLSSEFRSAIQLQFEELLKGIDDREEVFNVIVIVTEDKDFTIHVNEVTGVIVIRIIVGDSGSDISLDKLEDLQRRLYEIEKRIDELVEQIGLNVTTTTSTTTAVQPGIPPEFQKDDNNDGIPDILEDRNSNGYPDYFERDNNNDGIVDYEEDENNNGIPDYIEAYRRWEQTLPDLADPDGDGIPNFWDDDDDNDGVEDGICANLFLCNEYDFLKYEVQRDSTGKIIFCGRTEVRRCGCRRNETEPEDIIPLHTGSACTCSNDHCPETNDQCHSLEKYTFAPLSECEDYYKEDFATQPSDLNDEALVDPGPSQPDTRTRSETKQLCERKLFSYDAKYDKDGKIIACDKIYIHACGCKDGEPAAPFTDDSCVCTKKNCLLYGSVCPDEIEERQLLQEHLDECVEWLTEDDDDSENNENGE